MKNYFNSILEGFEFSDKLDFVQSIAPTFRYDLLLLIPMISFPLATISKIFGLDALAIGALLVVMLLEVCSGLYASRIAKIPFSSRKLSRFTFKVACYLVLISVPYLFFVNYQQRGNHLAASIFEWLHVFLVTQIVLENIFSILENIAVINGQSKTYWIEKIKKKINGML